MTKLVLAGLAGLLLAGCAPVVYTKADLDGRIVCNAEAMEIAEQKMRRSIGHVVWVNCPQGRLRVVSS